MKHDETRELITALEIRIEIPEKFRSRVISVEKPDEMCMIVWLIHNKCTPHENYRRQMI